MSIGNSVIFIRLIVINLQFMTSQKKREMQLGWKPALPNLWVCTKVKAYKLLHYLFWKQKSKTKEQNTPLSICASLLAGLNLSDKQWKYQPKVVWTLEL